MRHPRQRTSGSQRVGGRDKDNPLRAGCSLINEHAALTIQRHYCFYGATCDDGAMDIAQHSVVESPTTYSSALLQLLGGRLRLTASGRGDSLNKKVCPRVRPPRAAVCVSVCMCACVFDVCGDVCV